MGLWGWPWGRRGPSGFDGGSTAEEVTAGIDASHLTAIVTGATNGIGKETARVLAMRGAKVIIPARTLESGLKVKESLADQVPASKLHVMEMDLSSLSSVRSFAQSFNSSHKHLNILINNAGIMACPFQLSKDGIELQFATNHVGHFLLTYLLLDKMKETTRETGLQGRIINVSSIAHKRSDGSCFDLKKLNDKARYSPFIAYSHSKLANILHANELSRRFQEEGCNLTANSLHPGVIVTNIARYIATNSVLVSILSVAKPFLKGIPQGAATTCYLALHPDLKDVSGKYFASCNEATPTPVARDAELAKRLWSFSEELAHPVASWLAQSPPRTTGPPQAEHCATSSQTRGRTCIRKSGRSPPLKPGRVSQSSRWRGTSRTRTRGPWRRSLAHQMELTGERRLRAGVWSGATCYHRCELTPTKSCKSTGVCYT